MSDYYQQEVRFGFGAVTHAVQRIIVITTGVFVLQLLLDLPLGDAYVRDAPGGFWLTEYGSFATKHVLRGFLWEPFTYMLLHAGLSHLFFNMLMLFMFGSEVERVLGSRQFVRFYVFCGAAGVLVNFLPYYLYRSMYGGDYEVSVLGASGAVLGVIMAFAMVEPNRKLFLFPLPFPITARWLVIIIVGMNIVTGINGGSNTSVATHLGGLGAGYLYMKYRPIWNRRRWRRGSIMRESKEGTAKPDEVGKAVDNIFEFKGRGRKH
jgi:rhomboid family protein